MNPKDSIPTLQATAAMMLPGLKQARSLLEVCIRVLQYFESQVAQDAAAGSVTSLQGVERSLINEAENVKTLLVTFGRLHGKSN